MVAIKDMEMPKNCAECILFHFYFDLDGVMHYVCKCGNMEMCGYLENKRNDFCPLIEVDKCTYKETGCGSCKRQLDCPIESNKESEE